MKFEAEQTDDLGARAGVLEIGNVKIQTPLRILRATDVYGAESVEEASNNEISISFPHPIYQAKIGLSEWTLDKLVKEKAYQKTKVYHIRSLLKKKADAVSWFEARIPTNATISGAQNTAVLKLGLEAGAAVNCIYDSTSITPAQLEQRVKGSVKEAGAYPTCKGLIVKVSLAQSIATITKKLMIAKQYTDGATCKYAPPQYVHSHYLAAKSVMGNADTFFGLSDIPSTWEGNDRTSFMHVAQLYGFDAFSLKLGKWMDTERVLPRRRFDLKSLGYLTMPHEHKERHKEETACFCRCPIDRHFQNMQEECKYFSPAEQASAFRVHESFESQQEFALNREAIMEGNHALLNQLREHEFAKQPVKDIFGYDIGQKRVDEF